VRFCSLCWVGQVVLLWYVSPKLRRCCSVLGVASGCLIAAVGCGFFPTLAFAVDHVHVAVAVHDQVHDHDHDHESPRGNGLAHGATAAVAFWAIVGAWPPGLPGPRGGPLTAAPDRSRADPAQAPVDRVGSACHYTVVPRPLFYVVLAVIVVLWLQRVARLRAARPAAPDPHMPKNLVCGACGREYDPQKNGWLCPQCHK